MKIKNVSLMSCLTMWFSEQYHTEGKVWYKRGNKLQNRQGVIYSWICQVNVMYNRYTKKQTINVYFKLAS